MRSVSFRLRGRLRPAGAAEPRRSPGATGSASANRLGATLTEVLMAILIMAVGVVSVFTLFPISVIRTIQATNQTNAKILKGNVAEQVQQSPGLLFGFSESITNPAPASPFAGFTMQGEWQPSFAYDENHVIVPTVKAGSSIPRPFGFFVVTSVNPLPPPLVPMSGRVEPVWNPQATAITDGDITWAPLNLNRYVIDPLGLNTARSDGQSNAVVDTFGNKTDKNTGAATANGLPRIHSGLTHVSDVRLALHAAANVCVHPDSWQQLFEATPISSGPSSVEFPASIDLTGFFPTSPALVNPRVVLTSLDGTQTVVRELSGAPVGQTVNWSSAEPLPLRFPAADVGLARIEVFNRRYSWFMTVRNVGARPEIKCVVTFNRGFNTAEEHAYNANFANDATDVDGQGGPDGAQHGLGAGRGDWVKIAWDPATEADPLLKAGNFLFDARDASWYRIQSVDLIDLTVSPRFAIITLDKSVRVQTPDTGPQFPGRAILMPGIVEVFDL